MISEQTLHLVLRERVPDAADGRHQRYREHRPAKGLPVAGKENEHPYNAVDASLDVDRREQARNVRWCRRVRVRKPGVKRNEARFDCKSEKTRNEQQRQCPCVPSGLSSEICEFPATGPVVKQDEEDVEE